MIKLKPQLFQKIKFDWLILHILSPGRKKLHVILNITSLSKAVESSSGHTNLLMINPLVVQKI